MSDTDGDSPSLWDEVVDVVCVGTSPGVLAYAICCAANDFDVLVVKPAAVPDALGDEWHAAMTADLAGAGQTQSEFTLTRVVPAPEPAGKRERLETFVGEHLRQWSAHCLNSPFGVIFSQVPELLVPVHTDRGHTITAAFLGELDNATGDIDLAGWLARRARECGLKDPENAMAAIALDEGRIGGVELDDGYRVGARDGLALPVGAGSAVPSRPGRDGLTVALVGRPAGRFATVELLER